MLNWKNDIEKMRNSGCTDSDIQEYIDLHFTELKGRDVWNYISELSKKEADITAKVESIKKEIKNLQDIIKVKYSDGQEFFVEAAVRNADNAIEYLEFTRAMCDIIEQDNEIER